jgi:hypothetical protein
MMDAFQAGSLLRGRARLLLAITMELNDDKVQLLENYC